MNNELLRGLVYNASLLLSISIIYNTFLKFEKNKKYNNVIIGLIVGIFGILVMINTVNITSGIFFDTRSILVSVTALFFGFVPTVISSTIIIAYRAFIGGDGAVMGVAATMLSSVIGLLWHYFRINHIFEKKNSVWLEFYIFGLIVHMGMLLCTLALPREYIVIILRQIFVPVILIYPIGSLFLCMVIFTGFKNLQTKLALEDSKVFLMSLINSIPDLIFYKDCEGVYIGCNKAFEEFAGREEKDIIRRTDFELFENEMAVLFRTMDKEMLKQNHPRKNEEVVTYPDGNKVFLETMKTPYYDSEGNILGLIGVSRDITERKQKEEKILYLNYHDVLTGLYNRAFFDEELKRLDTERQLPLSVIIGDINGLKLINDALGHAEGDKLLVAMAKILKNCCRAEDIIARTGGDEFGILLPKTDHYIARSVVDRIKKACEEYANKTDKEIYYASISLGHATKNKTEESLGKTVEIAENYMYRRKLLEYKSLHSSIVSSIRTTMFEKSHETEAHAERMAELSKELGRVLGLTEEKLIELELLSTLHDIGKISIDSNILSKPGILTKEEWSEIKKHPEVGFRITQASPELRHISEYILSHHERWDGGGYPQGLSGMQIPLLSRILLVVDSYDAMTQDRTYRKAMTKEAAAAEILNNAGTQFDPVIARVFVEKVLHIKHIAYNDNDNCR